MPFPCMRVHTGNQAVIVVLATSLICALFVYAASMRVEDAAGRVDPKANVVTGNAGGGADT